MVEKKIIEKNKVIVAMAILGIVGILMKLFLTRNLNSVNVFYPTCIATLVTFVASLFESEICRKVTAVAMAVNAVLNMFITIISGGISAKQLLFNIILVMCYVVFAEYEAGILQNAPLLIIASICVCLNAISLYGGLSIGLRLTNPNSSAYIVILGKIIGYELGENALAIIFMVKGILQIMEKKNQEAEVLPW